MAKTGDTYTLRMEMIIMGNVTPMENAVPTFDGSTEWLRGCYRFRRWAF